MDGLRSLTNNLLRENGALQYQIHQLAPPVSRREDGSDRGGGAPELGKSGEHGGYCGN